VYDDSREKWGSLSGLFIERQPAYALYYIGAVGKN
jgi:hypothetical protein